MRRDQLEHLIRAAGAILGEPTVIVVGSQAILASTADPPETARRSIEADILPADGDESKADLIDGTIGELSIFQETFGVYAQGVGPQTALLPAGWEGRLVPLSNQNTGGVTGLCLEPHDLCVAKLLAGRQKDIEFYQELVAAAVVDPATVLRRLAATAVDDARRALVAEQIAAVIPPNP